MKNNFTLEDVDFSRRTVSIENNVDFLDKLEERQYLPILTEEEKDVLDRVWRLIEFICGGRRKPDFLIMYLTLDQGISQREVAEMLNVSHMAINKRYRKICNALKFLLGQDCGGYMPYRKPSGPKGKL